MKKNYQTLEDLKADLNEFSLYTENWDGENSSAVKSQTIQNCISIVGLLPETISLYTDVYVTPFGSLVLDWRINDKVLNIEIWESATSGYFYIENKKVETFESFNNIQLPKELLTITKIIIKVLS